jgi:hypothetical protein
VGGTKCKTNSQATAVKTVQNTALIKDLGILSKGRTVQVYLTGDRDVFEGEIGHQVFSWLGQAAAAEQVGARRPSRCLHSYRSFGFSLTGDPAKVFN